MIFRPRPVTGTDWGRQDQGFSRGLGPMNSHRAGSAGAGKRIVGVKGTGYNEPDPHRFFGSFYGCSENLYCLQSGFPP